MDNNQDHNAGKKTTVTMLTAMFASREGAEGAYKALNEKGYSKDDIHVLMSVETRNNQFPSHIKAAAAGINAGDDKNAVRGIGMLANAIAAVESTRLIPGLGIVVAGPLAGKLAGNGAANLKDGLVGLMVSAGIPEKWATVYELGLRSDHIVVGVLPRNAEDAEFLLGKWQGSNAREINS